MFKVILEQKQFTSYMESLVGYRFTKIDDINDLIEDNFGFNPNLVKKNRSKEEDEYFDYVLESSCTIGGKDYCYLDIYYLNDNKGNLYITEICTNYHV